MKSRFYSIFLRPLLLILPAAMMAACSSSADRKESAAESEMVFEASVLKKEKLSYELNLPGELEGYYETGIMAKVNGYVKTMKVDIGDRVTEGQLLAELEAPELVSQVSSSYAEYQAHEAMYLNTKGKYLRLKQTNLTPGAVSPYDMDLARTNYISDSLGWRAAKAKYEAVNQLVNYLRITAPFDGIITERALAPGAFVGPGDKQGMPLFRLKKETVLRLHVAVPEKYLAEVATGDEVGFSVKSFPGEIFKGRISRLSKNLNIQTRSEIVEIEINNVKGKLLPGMYAIATIPIRRPNMTIVVPATAVVTNMEKQFVIRIRQGNVVEHVDVEKGEENKGMVEIFGKLQEGDTVLNVGSDEIRNKDKVRIIVVDEKHS